MVTILKTLLFTLLVMTSSYAIGESKLDADLDSWIKSNRKAVMRQRVLVSETIIEGSLPAVKDLKMNDYFRMLGLKQPPLANTKLFYLVNDFKPKDIQEAGQILRMDLALELSPEKMTFTHLASNRRIEIPGQFDQENLSGRLRKAFGYDGYVVDVKQNLILARVTGNLLKVGSQAIIVDSSDPFLSTDSKIQASSLIEMVARRGDFGLFRVIIGNTGDAIQAGSRVQFSTQ